MQVIIGLGNPENRYNGTRHNIGFEVIDQFAEINDIEIKKTKHKALIGEGFVGGKKIMLVKPQTYMNLSGESALDVVEYYDVPLENLLIIYDDIDLEVGKMRIRSKGSAGTHNGMRSIVQLLQETEIPRLRMGIGRPEKQDLVSYVLGKFTPEERMELKDTLKKAGQAIEVFISKGVTEAMNQFNQK